MSYLQSIIDSEEDLEFSEGVFRGVAKLRTAEKNDDNISTSKYQVFDNATDSRSSSTNGSYDKKNSSILIDLDIIDCTYYTDNSIK